MAVDFSVLSPDFSGILAVVVGVFAAVAVVTLTSKSVSLVLDSVRSGPRGLSPIDDLNSPERRAYRRSSAFRMQNGASYARWARRNRQ